MTERGKTKTVAAIVAGEVTTEAPSEATSITGRAQQGARPTRDGATRPFWETKTLDQMSRVEWEALCDGCARCCMVKLEDDDTNTIHLTRLACSMLDVKTCRCSNYANRFKLMPDCIDVTLEKVRTLKWLPESCAYRRIDEGRGLAWWHPLISGRPETVHEAGISVSGFAMSEKRVKFENYQRYIIPDFEPEKDR